MLKIVAVGGPLLVAGLAALGAWTGYLDPPDVNIDPEMVHQAREAMDAVVVNMTPEPGPTAEALREALVAADEDDLWVGAAIEVLHAAGPAGRMEALDFVIEEAERRRRQKLLEPTLTAAINVEKDHRLLLKLEAERKKIRGKYGASEYRGVPVRTGLADED